MTNAFAFAPSADPFAWLAAMRAAGPVLPLGGDQRWLALGYDACLAALRDHGAFSSSVMGGMGRQGRERGGFGLTMLGTDPPDHTRLRGLVSHAFTPRRIAMLEPRIAALADELLDAVDPETGFDLMGAFAEPLPVTIIAEMLGIPAADRADFKRWSDSVVRFGGMGQSGDGNSERLDAVNELREYLRHALARRRTQPTDDLIGALVAAEEAGDRLSPEEALATCVLLLIAGNETTTNLIGNAIVALADHGLLAEVVAEPALLPGAIEETLRYAPPVLTVLRLATRDTELGGRTIPAGAVVFVALAAANRDPAVFESPERFDIRRAGGKSLAFGYGIHFCLGAPLARLEARIGLEILLRRFPTLRRAEDGPVERLASFVLYGPKRLPVRA